MSTAAPDRDEKLRADLASLRIERDITPIGRGPRRRWPRRLVMAFLVLAVAAGVAWLIVGRSVPIHVVYATADAPEQAGPAPVLSGSGYVVTGERYVSIGVRVPGRIDHYFVEEGQSVHQGDALVQLDDRDYRALLARTEAGLALARANLDLARADLARSRALHQQRVISQQELDVQRNRVEVTDATVRQLQAELEQARVNLEYTVLRAPTDGVILAKLKEVGEIAVPGGFAGSGDLIRLANLSDMRAEVDVNEADLNRVHMGQAAQVAPDAYPDVKYAAAVVKLYPQVDRQKGTLKVEVRIRQPDTRLLPDMSARITFLSDPQDGQAPAAAVLVPAAALHRSAQGDNFVWLVSDGRVHSTVVETAGDVGDRVRIRSGLRGGEALAVSERPLRDGQKVRVPSP